MIMISFSRLSVVNKKDCAAINRLLRELSSSSSGLTYRGFRSIIKDANVSVYVARFGKEIIGMGTIAFVRVPGGLQGRIEDVVVDNAYRGQGIGKTLMEKLIARARTKKVSFIELTSRPSREAANALYQKLGFMKRETNVYRLTIP